MTGDLGASQDTITWVLTSYIVAAAIMTPVTGWLSDRFGRKELFLTSVVGFTVTSMLCGLAWSLESMVLFRAAAGRVRRGDRAAVADLPARHQPEGAPRLRPWRIWGAGIMVGPIIGPTLGGWLTDSFNWRWVFFINLPVGIIAFLGMAAYLPAIAKRLRGFDFFGFAMLSLGVGALQLMLDRGGEVDWFSAAEIWIELGLAITGFWVFTVHLLTAEHPFIDPKIFADRNFVDRAGLHLRHRHHPAGEPGAAAADAVDDLRLSDHHHRHRHGAARRRHDDLDDRGRPHRPAWSTRGYWSSLGLLLTAQSLYTMTGFTPQMDDYLIIDVRRRSRGWGSAWCSCRCRRWPSPRSMRASAPTPRACSAWCATSARRSASRS